MGHWFRKYMAAHGIYPRIIDPHLESADPIGSEKIIRAHADRATLREAGIENVAGIVAGTDDDSDNLSILLSTEALNPGAFTIVRQNDHVNQIAFDAANVDLVLQSSLTTARRILKHLISPLIQTLIDYLQDQDEQLTDDLVRKLQTAVGDQTPHLWRVNICPNEARAAIELLDEGHRLTLEDAIRDPADRRRTLSCIPLMMQRDGECIMLPSDRERTRVGDEVVFCGTARSKRLLAATLNNPYTLKYLVTGVDPPRGYFFDWLAKRAESSKAAAAPG
jgi:hypothetical protein